MTEKQDYRKSRRHKTIGVAIGVLWILVALVLIVYYEPREDGVLYLLGIALFGLMGVNHVQKVLAEKDSFLDWFSQLP